MNKNLIIGVLALLAVIGGFLYFSKDTNILAGTTNLNSLNLDTSLIVGPSGSTINELVATTCTLTTTVSRLPLATSSQPFDCAVTGMASGDIVFGSLASDGGSLSGTTGIRLSSINASTTAGYAQVWLSHQSDNVLAAATSSFALATTSFQVLYIDN
jgi:hypothetical protein